jgi:signal transduction histidine kinase/HPt (histidine-containing phosphotransfer) domain-containing protein/ActR/RegA family two-component response regulator
MRLTTKVTLTLVVLIVLSLFLNYVVFHTYLAEGFTELEQHLARRDMDRCRAALQREAEYLGAFVKDWAQWDDTCKFMAGRKAVYEEANLQFTTFKDNKLSVIRYYDEAGTLFWGKMFDLDAGKEISSTEFISRTLLHPHQPENSVAGILLTELGPLLVASSTILTSDAEGPPRGVLMMGRNLDDDSVTAIARNVGVTLRVWPLRDKAVPTEAQRWLKSLPLRGEYAFAHEDRNHLSVYSVVESIDGQSALLMATTVPCEVTARGRATLYYATISIALVGLIILLAILRLMHFLILEPVGELTENVLTARRTSTMSAPLRLNRRDELGTLSKEFEDTLREWAEAKDASEKANRAKSEFLAAVSHELRTPLNGIVGLSELITASHSRDAHKAHARRIIREAETLVTLINELLDSAKIEAGKLTVENIPFNLLRLMEEISAVTGINASQKGLAFNMTADPRIPSVLMGDPYRIRQVLINLIGNALKFTDKGSVNVKVSIREDAGDAVLLRFVVIDTGIGIPKEKQPRLFQRFAQADDSTSRKYGGTGLGTAISRDLVVLMGGEIGLESEEGRGSTFWFDLRLKKGGAADVVAWKEIRDEAEGLAHRRSGRVLLVEDYVTSQQVATEHLQAAGYEVELAKTGQEALARAGQTHFDVILLDVRLPDVDGMEVARRIRAGASPNTHTPIVAVTADATETVKQECLNAGMNNVVAKPLRREGLLSAIANYMNPKTRKPPMDWARAVREFSGNEAVVDGLVGTFLETVRRQLGTMGAALDQSRFEELRRDAHSIRGGAGNLVAEPLAEAARHVEDAAKAGEIKRCRDALKDLSKELSRLEEQIHGIRSARKG